MFQAALPYSWVERQGRFNDVVKMHTHTPPPQKKITNTQPHKPTAPRVCELWPNPNSLNGWPAARPTAEIDRSCTDRSWACTKTKTDWLWTVAEGFHVWQSPPEVEPGICDRYTKSARTNNRPCSCSCFDFLAVRPPDGYARPRLLCYQAFHDAVSTVQTIQRRTAPEGSWLNGHCIP
jgi:hypothetical protein